MWERREKKGTGPWLVIRNFPVGGGRFDGFSPGLGRSLLGYGCRPGGVWGMMELMRNGTTRKRGAL